MSVLKPVREWASFQVTMEVITTSTTFIGFSYFAMVFKGFISLTDATTQHWINWNSKIENASPLDSIDYIPRTLIPGDQKGSYLNLTAAAADSDITLAKTTEVNMMEQK